MGNFESFDEAIFEHQCPKCSKTYRRNVNEGGVCSACKTKEERGESFFKGVNSNMRDQVEAAGIKLPKVSTPEDKSVETEV